MSAAAAHVVLLLTVTGDPSSEVVSRAAAASLAAPFVEPPRVVLRAVAASEARAPGPTLERLGGADGADVVVVLACARPGCARATLRVSSGGAPPITKVVRFGPRDQLAERGRALGLLASTFLPDGWSRAAPAAGTSGAAEPVAGATPAGRAAAPPAAPATIDAPLAPLPPAATPRWTFETSAGLFAGTSEGVSEAGLTLAAQRTLVGAWAARAALKLELGETPGDAATSRAVGGALGVAWSSAGLARPGHFGLAARADLVAVERKVKLNLATEVEQRSGAAVGGDAMAQVGFALSSGAALVAGLGAELLSQGPTVTDLDDRVRGAAPPQFRVVGELGMWARF
jgi:hypothetical protein